MGCNVLERYRIKHVVDEPPRGLRNSWVEEIAIRRGNRRYNYIMSCFLTTRVPIIVIVGVSRQRFNAIVRGDSTRDVNNASFSTTGFSFSLA